MGRLNWSFRLHKVTIGRQIWFAWLIYYWLRMIKPSKIDSELRTGMYKGKTWGIRVRVDFLLS